MRFTRQSAAPQRKWRAWSSRSQTPGFCISVFAGRPLCLGILAGFAECLTSGIERSAELLFLLADHFLALLHPFAHCLAGFTAAALQKLPAFIRGVHHGFAGLAARTGGVKYAHKRARSEEHT